MDAYCETLIKSRQKGVAPVTGAILTHRLDMFCFFVFPPVPNTAAESLRLLVLMTICSSSLFAPHGWPPKAFLPALFDRVCALFPFGLLATVGASSSVAPVSPFPSDLQPMSSTPKDYPPLHLRLSDAGSKPPERCSNLSLSSADCPSRSASTPPPVVQDEVREVVAVCE